MCSVPARILPPLRGQVVRRISGESSSVSVTFIVENSGEDTNRAFPFPVARRAPDVSDTNPREVRRDDVLVECEERERGFGAAQWTQHASASSSRFLAGLIAQERPGIRLHNPPHQTATRVYRATHSLGLRSARPVRHSTRI